MHPLTIPAYPKRLSLITLLFGIGVFLWLTPEDTVWLAALLGVGIALIGTAHAVFKFASGRTFRARTWFPGLIGIGAASGAGAVVATIGLMLIKTSVHNHLYPDYSLGVMAAMAQRLGSWSLAGACIGLAVALLLAMR